MKNKIQKFDEISEKLEENHAKFEAKRGVFEGSEKLAKIKKALNTIKNEVFKVEQRLGIIRGTLTYKEETEEEKHHLYDDINDFEL